MFPGIYGFVWDTGHIVFLGAFYLVASLVLATVSLAAIRSYRDFRLERDENLRWMADFHDLPRSCRRCRHELAGEVGERTCELGFDCRRCVEHARLSSVRSTGRTGSRDGAIGAMNRLTGGFELPLDRSYHRGHAWVRRERDGTSTIGLDDLGSRLLGQPDSLVLPPVGARLCANGTAWHSRKNGIDVRVLSPIDGEVLALGGVDSGWYLKVKPVGAAAADSHLLGGAEARAWLLSEVERLQLVLAADGVGAALADGGEPVADISRVLVPAEYDAACGSIFLDP